MALFIIGLDHKIGAASEWRDTFKAQFPDLPIRFWPDAGDVSEIEYLAFMHPDFDALPAFPNLKAMRPAWKTLSITQNCQRLRSARSTRRAAIR